MSVIKAEVYYGFYSGNSQLWDTLYVYIPAETPESDIESVAVEKFYEEYGDAENVAFTGLFHWEYDEDCGCGDCESCNEE